MYERRWLVKFRARCTHTSPTVGLVMEPVCESTVCCGSATWSTHQLDGRIGLHSATDVGNPGCATCACNIVAVQTRQIRVVSVCMPRATASQRPSVCRNTVLSLHDVPSATLPHHLPITSSKSCASPTLLGPHTVLPKSTLSVSSVYSVFL